MKMIVLTCVAALLMGGEAVAQDAGLLLGLRTGDARNQDGEQSYRTIWIQQHGGDISVSELPWLLIPTSMGFRRVAYVRVIEGQHESEEQIELVPIPGDVPAAEERAGPEEFASHGMCGGNIFRSIIAAGRRALLVRVLTSVECPGPLSEDETTELVSTVGAPDWGNFSQRSEALFSLPMALKPEAKRDRVWPAVRKLVPRAQRAFVAPTRRLVAVLTDRAVVVRPLRAENLDRSSVTLPLRFADSDEEREELVMVEWAAAGELADWAYGIRSFLNQQ